MADARRRTALVLALVAAAVASACAPAPASKVGGLRARLNADILSTDPGVLRDENTDAVLLHVVEGLVAYRENLSIGPLLAQSWEVSPDGKAYIFRLRSGVRFHDGRPLTSADVVWSLHRYLDPATRWRCRSELTGGGYARLTKVAAVDPLTVRVELDRPSPLFLQTLARADCGETAIMSSSSVNADGSWRGPVGTGPYKLSQWRRNEFVDLTRFEGYRSLSGPRDGDTGGKQALAARIRFLIVPDASSALAALQRGSLDVLDGLSPAEAEAVQTLPGLRLDAHPSLDVFALLLQSRNPALADPRLRRALALSLDVPALARAATDGYAQPNRSIVPVASPFRSAVQASIPVADLAAARRMALAAGYRGQPIVLTTNRRYPAMFATAVLVQAMARRAGLNVRIDVTDWASELARYNQGTYQAMAFGYSARLDPSGTLDAMVGDAARDPRKVWTGPEATALLAQSRALADPARRTAIFNRLDALLRRDVPAVILFNSIHLTGLRRDVRGFSGWPAGRPRLWGVEAVG